MIHNAIWDFDGTLFDTYPAMAKAFHSALMELAPHPAVTVDEIQQKMQISMGEAERCFLHSGNIDMAGFNAIYRPVRTALEASDCKPFPAAKKICSQLLGAGGRNFIFTHRSRSTLGMLDQFGMLCDFECIITSEDGFAAKPAPDAIEHLLKKYDIDRDDAIMIGDREIDVRSGYNAHIRTCLFTSSADVSTVAENVIADLNDLSRILGI